MTDFNTMDNFDFSGKTVIARLDLNSPMDPQTGEFLDTRRIEKHAITVKELSEKGAKVVVLSHQGRPGSRDFTTLNSHTEYLQKEVGIPIEYIEGGLISPGVVRKIKEMKDGEIILLENVRFLSEENISQPADVQAKTHFVGTLAPLADIYVGDAFATAHRSQSSLVGFPEILPSCAGRVMERELSMLSEARNSDARPSVFSAGGAKVRDSLKVIAHFLDRGVVDTILTSGLVASVFLVAKGYTIDGLEYMENYDSLVRKAKALYNDYSDKILLPEDLAADKYGKRLEIPLSELPIPYKISDIGSKTAEKYSEILRSAKTIIANGPAGIFEDENFAKGTNEIAKAIAESGGFTVVGGGHIATAIRKLNLGDKITHISTGGGACILFLAGEKLPAIEALKKAKEREAK
ncbi:MAG: phosphoglycerate kinase [Euryarchaeota archaeon]|nr:phosphoglycerate kinase [Euryarchaeota archaeon]|tara:strand:+ start:9625 stop:10845 length:1221 start_codon:yes stop_codon:yes gene_type:complete